MAYYHVDMEAQPAPGQLIYDAWATAWGPIAAVAGRNGLCRLVLPHYPLDQLLELLAWEHPGATRSSDRFEPLIELTRAYFNAKEADFSIIDCDLPPAGSFSGKVLGACREIPPGRTMSYSALAERIGQPSSARAVATALSKNKIPLVIPCHRVIYADGRAGGFSAEAGPQLKQRMISMESRRVSP